MSTTMTQYWNDPQLYDNWRTRESVSGGGIIADSVAHWIDILRWLFGEISALTAAGIPAPDSPMQKLDDTSLSCANSLRGRWGVFGIVGAISGRATKRKPSKFTGPGAALSAICKLRGLMEEFRLSGWCAETGRK